MYIGLLPLVADAIHPSYHGYDFSPKFDRNAVPDNGAAFETATTSSESPSNNGLSTDAPPEYTTIAPSSLIQAHEPLEPYAAPVAANASGTGASGNESLKTTQLQRMVQQLYAAQAQVQLEAAEIQRAQTIASAAQQQLDDASNNVRVITAALRAAQETVATAALRAQTAQMQLSAHDQLLFTARQHVDALSAQMVGLQAELGIAGGDQRMSVDVPALLNRLRAPQPAGERAKPAAGAAAENQQPHALVIHSANADNGAATIKRSAQLEPEFTAGNVHDLLSWVRRAKDDDVARAVATADELAAVARGTDDVRWTDEGSDARRQRYVDDFVAKMRRLSAQGLGDSAFAKGMGAERSEWKNVQAQKNADLIRRTMSGVRRRRLVAERGDRE